MPQITPYNPPDPARNLLLAEQIKGARQGREMQKQQMDLSITQAKAVALTDIMQTFAGIRDETKARAIANQKAKVYRQGGLLDPDFDINDIAMEYRGEKITQTDRPKVGGQGYELSGNSGDIVEYLGWVKESTLGGKGIDTDEEELKAAEYDISLKPIEWKAGTREEQLSFAEEEAEAKAKGKEKVEGTQVFKGRSSEIQYMNTLMGLKDKITSGAATKSEQDQYKLAEWQLTQPKVVVDPTTGQQTVMTPTLPPGFPSLRDKGIGEPPEQEEVANIVKFYPINEPGQIQKVEIPKYRASLDKIALMRNKLKQLRTMIENEWTKSVPTYIDPGKTREFKTTYNEVLMNYKEVLNLGVLNGPDLVIMERILQDPTSPVTTILGKDYILKSIDRVFNTLTDEENFWRSKLNMPTKKGASSGEYIAGKDYEWEDGRKLRYGGKDSKGENIWFKAD